MNCKICGRENIMPSCGGPDICGECDCGGMVNVGGKKYIEVSYINSYKHVVGDDKFSHEELHTMREWFRVIRDTHSDYLEEKDYTLYEKIMSALKIEPNEHDLNWAKRILK